MGDVGKTVSCPNSGWRVSGSEKEIGAFQSLYILGGMCETIVFKNGTTVRALGPAGIHDVKSGAMVLICPQCHQAFIVSGSPDQVVAH